MNVKTTELQFQINKIYVYMCIYYLHQEEDIIESFF